MVSDPHLSCVAVFGNGGGDTFMMLLLLHVSRYMKSEVLSLCSMSLIAVMYFGAAVLTDMAPAATGGEQCSRKYLHCMFCCCGGNFSDDKEHIRKIHIVKRGFGLKTCLQKIFV